MTTINQIAWDDTVLPFQLDRSGVRGRVARLDGVLLASQDGSETPRQAISEVILGAMTACGAFAGQQTTATPTGRARLTGTR